VLSDDDFPIEELSLNAIINNTTEGTWKKTACRDLLLKRRSDTISAVLTQSNGDPHGVLRRYRNQCAMLQLVQLFDFILLYCPCGHSGPAMCYLPHRESNLLSVTLNETETCTDRVAGSGKRLNKASGSVKSRGMS
jgi:hypothetical protein